MIKHLLTPLVCERFRCDARYRDGHLRVVNALPAREVLGLHVPEMKMVAKQLSRNGAEVELLDGEHRLCSCGTEVIRCFEATTSDLLCYEETILWGFLINLEKCSLMERLEMLSRYVPVLDNWAVCDAYCANAKWIQRTDKKLLWDFLLHYFRSENEFEVRFAIVTAMTYLLDEEYLELIFTELNNLDIASIKSLYKSIKGKPTMAQLGMVQGAEPYYVRMAVAWLLATALARFPEQTRAFVRSSDLPDDVVKLYLRKARESLITKGLRAL
ncbi:MAG: DNA alkylation repair protein [Bacteroidaceae bacterium]|nr:DNA alkylation repair protein [Bacteroidaceae bacterium]